MLFHHDLRFQVVIKDLAFGVDAESTKSHDVRRSMHWYDSIDRVWSSKPTHAFQNGVWSGFKNKVLFIVSEVFGLFAVEISPYLH